MTGPGGQVIGNAFLDSINNKVITTFTDYFEKNNLEKNYTLNLKNSIIICTSNFVNLTDVRKTLGDPIYSRFDAFIEYKELSEEISKELIQIKFLKIYDGLTETDKILLNKEEALSNILRFAKVMKNAREIERVINEYIFSLLLKVKIENI